MTEKTAMVALGNGRSKWVAGWRWLTRFAWKVDSIQVVNEFDQPGVVQIVAHLSDGRLYIEGKLEPQALWDKLHRTRRFYGCSLIWLGISTKIEKGQRNLPMPR